MGRESGVNYGRCYDRIIERAWLRVDGPGEWHHVVPCCMGGKKLPVVRLTYKEHFVAHILLVKMYPRAYRLIWAANLMANRWGSGRNYAWLRAQLRQQMLGNTFGTGHKLSLTARKKISAFHTGNKWNLGKHLSKEAKAKISAVHKGRIFTLEHRDKLRRARLGKSPSNKGTPCSAEARAKISASLTGRVQSPETIEKRRRSLTGKRKGVPGHKQSPDARARIAQALRGRPKSEETRRKMSEAQRGNTHALGLIRGPMSAEHKLKMLLSREQNKQRRLTHVEAG